MTETWRPIAGWRTYEASSLGRVRKVRILSNGPLILREKNRSRRTSGAVLVRETWAGIKFARRPSGTVERFIKKTYTREQPFTLDMVLAGIRASDVARCGDDVEMIPALRSSLSKTIERLLLAHQLERVSRGCYRRVI